jgi:hypothetical protein
MWLGVCALSEKIKKSQPEKLSPPKKIKPALAFLPQLGASERHAALSTCTRGTDGWRPMEHHRWGLSETSQKFGKCVSMYEVAFRRNTACP